MFVVERDGEPLPYLGIELRRLPIEQSELVPMAAGETLETVVDLVPLYPVDVPGTYSIRYAPREMTVGVEVTTPPAGIEAGRAGGRRGAHARVTRRGRRPRRRVDQYPDSLT